MNKIKLLYDVVKTMKDKEKVSGVLTAAIERNQMKIFSLKNEFEKHANGRMKANIQTEWEYDGKMGKHESTTELTMPAHERRGHCFHRMHGQHPHFSRFGGFRGKLTALSFALGLLNALQVEEQQDKTILVSLKAGDMPEDMRELLRERIQQAQEFHPHGFMKEFGEAEVLDFDILAVITAQYELEKIIITVDGTRGEGSQEHKMNGSLIISFAV